jgi:hypothetical protein
LMRESIIVDVNWLAIKSKPAMRELIVRYIYRIWCRTFISDFSICCYAFFA